MLPVLLMAGAMALAVVAMPRVVAQQPQTQPPEISTTISGDANGKVTEMLTDPDYELRPLAAQGDVLLVRALRTRGTRRFELWGVDVASGKKLWQTIFDKEGGPMLGPDRAAGLLSKEKLLAGDIPVAGADVDGGLSDLAPEIDGSDAG